MWNDRTDKPYTLTFIGYYQSKMFLVAANASKEDIDKIMFKMFRPKNVKKKLDNKN